MRIHKFTVNHRKRNADGRWSDWFNRTIYLTLYGKNDREIFQWHAQIVVRRPRAEFSLRFHVGNRGSETPWDGHVTVLGNGIYWGHSRGRRLAQWLTRGEGRDVSLSMHGERVYWRLWADPNERKRTPRWRDSSVLINPLDRILGPKRWSYEDLDWALVTIDLDGTKYPVRLTLQKSRLQRARGRVLREHFSVDWNAPRGIPTEPDSWKGGRTYGSGFSIVPRGYDGDWVRQATWHLTGWVCQERARRGFRTEVDLEKAS